MINETLLVQQYLNGENINEDILYRIYFLLAKYYKENGISNLSEVRSKIYEWKTKNNIKNSPYLNNAIINALNDKRRLTTDNLIRISLEDIDLIKSKFDTKNTRLSSLAILCYAKQFADSNKEFNISITALGDWIHINKSNLSGRYIKELVNFEYIIYEKQTNNYKTWMADVKSKTKKFKILASIKNQGEYVLKDNDIFDLYNKVFG